MVLAELVLVSRLLGLVTGEYPVAIHVHPLVERVELLRNGETVATLRGAPWQVLVNFGAELAPQELTAIAYDAGGNVIGRDTQLVNLPRPAAEADIDLRREGEKLKAAATWQHIGAANVRDISWKLDGKRVGNGEVSVVLPALESKNLHVIEVAVTFWDNVIARKERVFGGIFSEEVPTELTGALVHVGEGKADPASCFRLGSETVPAAAIEKPEALVVFVRNPDPALARRAFRSTSREGGRMRFDLQSDVRIMWPTAQAVVEKERHAVANLFEHSQVIEGKIGTYTLLTGRGGPRINEHRYADAIAVSGVYAALGARRRAVVLVIGNEKDKSRQSPAIVRRYLERIGVPLRVWSLVGAKKDVTDVWGEVVDISNAAKLQRATEELTKELERQRVAWLPLQPLDALKVQAAADCGLVPVAKN